MLTLYWNDGQKTFKLYTGMIFGEIVSKPLIQIPLVTDIKKCNTIYYTAENTSRTK